MKTSTLTAAILLITSSLFAPNNFTIIEKTTTFNYGREYNKVVEFIKDHEGFSDTVYLDTNGHKTIGYGCITDTLTKISRKEADKLLKNALNENIKYVEHHFPELKENKKLAVAHFFYAYGVGRVLKHKAVQKGELKLTQLGYKSNRIWEKNLFYKNYKILFVKVKYIL